MDIGRANDLLEAFRKACDEWDKRYFSDHVNGNLNLSHYRRSVPISPAPTRHLHVTFRLTLMLTLSHTTNLPRTLTRA